MLYLFVLGIGYALQVNGQAVTNLALTMFLIILAAIFPAFALLALGVRRLRFPAWSTSPTAHHPQRRRARRPKPTPPRPAL